MSLTLLFETDSRYNSNTENYQHKDTEYIVQVTENFKLNDGVR